MADTVWNNMMNRKLSSIIGLLAATGVLAATVVSLAYIVGYLVPLCAAMVSYLGTTAFPVGAFCSLAAAGGASGVSNLNCVTLGAAVYGTHLLAIWTLDKPLAVALTGNSAYDNHVSGIVGVEPCFFDCARVADSGTANILFVHEGYPRDRPYLFTFWALHKHAVRVIRIIAKYVVQFNSPSCMARVVGHLFGAGKTKRPVSMPGGMHSTFGYRAYDFTNWAF